MSGISLPVFIRELTMGQGKQTAYYKTVKVSENGRVLLGSGYTRLENVSGGKVEVELITSGDSSESVVMYTVMVAGFAVSIKADALVIEAEAGSIYKFYYSNGAWGVLYAPGKAAAADDTKLALAGGVMSGVIDMGGNGVINAKVPTVDGDVATKKYTDDAFSAMGVIKLSKSGGTMTGGIDMGGSGVSNMKTPVADADGVTKKYTDDAFSAMGIIKLSRSGGTMSGDINMATNGISNLKGPISPFDASNKKYVDDAVSTSASSMGDVLLPRVGGTMSGPINMDLNGIINMKEPVAPLDVATKKYVDESVVTASGGGDPSKLPLTGGVMSGAVDMGGFSVINVNVPSGDNHAATKKYVDDAVVSTGPARDATKLPLAGGMMTGGINMNSYKIENVPMPTADFEPAVKLYVDNLAFPKNGGTMQGEVNMGGNFLKNVRTPTGDNYAATKKYVDDAVVTKLPLAGGVITDEIDMGDNYLKNVKTPIGDNYAATKKYVDDSVGSDPTKLPLAGGVMTGLINMGDNYLTNVKTPGVDADAATKKYVDSHYGIIGALSQPVIPLSEVAGRGMPDYTITATSEYNSTYSAINAIVDSNNSEWAIKDLNDDSPHWQCEFSTTDWPQGAKLCGVTLRLRNYMPGQYQRIGLFYVDGQKTDDTWERMVIPGDKSLTQNVIRTWYWPVMGSYKAAKVTFHTIDTNIHFGMTQIQFHASTV